MRASIIEEAADARLLTVCCGIRIRLASAPDRTGSRLSARDFEQPQRESDVLLTLEELFHIATFPPGTLQWTSPPD